MKNSELPIFFDNLVGFFEYFQDFFLYKVKFTYFTPDYSEKRIRSRGRSSSTDGHLDRQVSNVSNDTTSIDLPPKTPNRSNILNAPNLDGSLLPSRQFEPYIQPSTANPRQAVSER